MFHSYSVVLSGNSFKFCSFEIKCDLIFVPVCQSLSDFLALVFGLPQRNHVLFMTLSNSEMNMLQAASGRFFNCSWETDFCSVVIIFACSLHSSVYVLGIPNHYRRTVSLDATCVGAF